MARIAQDLDVGDGCCRRIASRGVLLRAFVDLQPQTRTIARMLAKCDFLFAVAKAKVGVRAVYRPPFASALYLAPSKAAPPVLVSAGSHPPLFW